MEALGSAATVLQLISFTGDVLVRGYSFLPKNALLSELQELAINEQKEDAKGALQMLDRLGIFTDCEKLMGVVEKSIQIFEQIGGEGVRSLGKKLLWPFKEKETKDVMEQLARLREALSAAVAVDSAKKLRNLETIAKSIDHNVINTLEVVSQVQLATNDAAKDVAHVKFVIDAAMREEERVAIRKWLHSDGIDSEASFIAALRMKHLETGKWLFELNEFSSWKASTGRCMWLHGIASCRKTNLSASVINYMQHKLPVDSSYTVYFFCDHRDPTKQSFQDLLFVIAKQLLEHDTSSFQEVKYWYDEKLAKERSEVPKPLSVVEYCILIKKICSRWNSVTLVVDALDECIELGDFALGLADLIGSSNIRLLVTSRETVDLRRELIPLSAYHVPMVDHMRNDIRTYLSGEVRTQIAAGRLKIKAKSLEDKIIVALEAKADGMILIAKLQLDYICRLKSDRAIKQALAELPSDIFETYDEILFQLCSKGLEEVKEIKKILQWLVYSIVPLTLRELAEAVSIQPGDIMLDKFGIATDLMDLAASCGGLVTLRSQDTQNSTFEDLRGSRITLITLAHASVEEYLTSGKIGRGLSEMFHMDRKIIHHELAKTCLQYIGFGDFLTPMGNNPVDGLQRNALQTALNANRRRLRDRTSIYALSDYASRYWPDHLRLSTFVDIPDEETTVLLSWFVNSQRFEGLYESWQQMYHHDTIWYCAGRPPLFYAIEFKIDNLVSLLLPEKGNLDTIVLGHAPLHVASRCGALSTIRELIRRGVSIELRSLPEAKNMTALHFAAEGGHANVVSLLLKLGASPNSRSESKSTPLYRAARSGSLETLKLLYEAGSDINARTWDNFTPLFEAVAYARVGIANQLLQWGADPTILTNEGNSPLSLIALARDHKRKQKIRGSFEWMGKEKMSKISGIHSGHEKVPLDHSSWNSLNDYLTSDINIREHILPHIIESLVLDDRDHSLKEDEVLREIQEIRAQDKDGTGFRDYIKTWSHILYF